VRGAYQRVLRAWLPALGVAKNIDGVTLRMAHGANNGSELPTLLRYLRADQRAAVRIEGSVRRQFGIGS
jgi:hypothetical protein